MIVLDQYIWREWKFSKILQCFKIQKRLSIQKPVSRKKSTTHYPIPAFFLNVLLNIFKAKKICKKKSLDKLILAADSLKTHFSMRQF